MGTPALGTFTDMPPEEGKSLTLRLRRRSQLRQSLQQLHGRHSDRKMGKHGAGASARHSLCIRSGLQQPERRCARRLLRRDLDTLFCWTAMSQPLVLGARGR